MSDRAGGHRRSTIDGTFTPRRVSVRRIEAALETLAALTAEDHPELDGATRDEIGHVRAALWEIADRRRRSDR